MEFSYFVEMKGGGRRDVPSRFLTMSDTMGVWQFEVDLKTDLGLEGERAYDELVEICKCNFSS